MNFKRASVLTFVLLQGVLTSSARAEKTQALPEDCFSKLSAADLDAIGSETQQWARGLVAGNAFLDLHAEFQRALAKRVSGLSLSSKEQDRVRAADSERTSAMKLLLKNGARLDSRGNFSLADFRFENLRKGAATELSKAFVAIFPSAYGRLVKISDPNRREALHIEGHVLLPPALKKSEPGQKFSAALSLADYRKAVASELNGLESHFSKLLVSARKGGNFSELIDEVSAFYTHDVWGKTAWERPHEAAERAEHDMAQMRLRRLKSKLGLTQEEMGVVLTTYARVLSQASVNREAALSDLSNKATAIALAPAIAPVVASSLLPAFATGLGFAGVDMVVGAGIQKSSRGGNYTCHLLEQIDRKLAPGVTTALLFSPLGALGKAAISVKPVVKVAARSGLVALSGAGAVGAVTSWNHSQVSKKAAHRAAAIEGIESPRAQAHWAESKEARTHAMVDAGFSLLGVTEFLPKPVHHSTRELPKNVLASASGRRAADITNNIYVDTQKFRQMNGAEKDRHLTSLCESARELLAELGTKLEPIDPDNSGVLVISPDRNGSVLNRAAWEVDQRYGTEVIFDPLHLVEGKMDAYFSGLENQIGISFKEVLSGKSSDDLKHEIIHLVRSNNLELPLHGRVSYPVKKADLATTHPYDKNISFQEVVTQTWDLTSMAWRLGRRMSVVDRKNYQGKLDMVLRVSGKTLRALRSTLIEVRKSNFLADTADFEKALARGTVRFTFPNEHEVVIPIKGAFLSQIRLARTSADGKRKLLQDLLMKQIESEISSVRSIEEQVHVVKDMGERALEKSALSLIKGLRKEIREMDQSALQASEKVRTDFLAKASQAEGEIKVIYRSPIQAGKPLSLKDYQKVLERVDQREETAREIYRLYDRDCTKADCMAADLKTLDHELSTWVAQVSHPLWLETAARHEERAAEWVQKMIQSKVSGKEADFNAAKKAYLFETVQAWDHFDTVDSQVHSQRFERQCKAWEDQLSRKGIWLD